MKRTTRKKSKIELGDVKLSNKVKSKNKEAKDNQPPLKKKRKKRPNNHKGKELAELTTAAKHSLNKRLEDSKSQVLQLAESIELIPHNKENEYFNAYNNIFESLKHLTLIAEDKYINSTQSRDVYALMAMYSQMRECIADMRSTEDFSAQANQLIEDVLDPLIRSIGEIMINHYIELESLIKQSLPSKLHPKVLKELKKLTASQATKVQDQYDSSKQSLLKVFSEIT